MNNFRHILKELRKENNLTQKELAKMIPTSEQSISHWETGYTEPNINELIRLCSIFNVTSDYIIGIEETEKQRINKYNVIINNIN